MQQVIVAGDSPKKIKRWLLTTQLALLNSISRNLYDGVIIDVKGVAEMPEALAKGLHHTAAVKQQ